MVSGGRTWWYDANVPGVQLIYNKTVEWSTKVGENKPFRRLYPTTLVKLVRFLYTASETGTFKMKEGCQSLYRNP